MTFEPDAQPWRWPSGGGGSRRLVTIQPKYPQLHFHMAIMLELECKLYSPTPI